MRNDGNYKDLAIIYFNDSKDLDEWLKKHHQASPGIWARIFKKNSGTPSLNWADAVPVLLQYGWIDSQAKGYDEVSYLQRFGPRKKNSLWSKINREIAEGLIKKGIMTAAGLAAVEEAKQNGSWERAYASPASIEMPEDFLNALISNQKAFNFYQSLNKTHKFAYLFRVVAAKKPETREKRIKQFVTKLDEEKKLY